MTRKKMDLLHGTKIQLMYQVMNIRGKQLLKKWAQYPRSTVYECAAKPSNGKVHEDKRHKNKGRTRGLTQHDERQVLRCIPRLRKTKGQFTSIDFQNESATTHVTNKTPCNYLHRHDIHYLRSRKKGILSLKNLKKRTTYCRKAQVMKLDLEFWTKHILFYLDSKWVHLVNKAPESRRVETYREFLHSSASTTETESNRS